MSKMSGILTSVAVTALSVALIGAPAYADGPVVGLITKTSTNKFFVKMKEGFEAKAKELGFTPQELQAIEHDNAVALGLVPAAAAA